MNIREKIATGFARAASSLAGPNAWKIFGSFLGDTGSVSGALNVPGTSRPAENLLWVYNCVMARSEAVMQARLRVSDAQDNYIESGPLVDLLSNPNPWMDGTQFTGAIESLLTVYNRAHIVPVGEGARPDELMLISPADTEPIVGIHRPTGMRVPMGWRHHAAGGDTITFMLDEVITIQSFNPHNPFIAALSPMHPLKRSMQMDVATREQNLAIFLNGGIPDIALETERDWQEDQAKEFLRRFMDNYGGMKNAHKPALLYNGVKINTIGLNPEELQSLEVLRTLTPQEIVSGLRTKPVMAGLMVGETGLSQGTSTEEQKIAWWSETGHSELARIAGALQEFLVDRYSWTGSRAGESLTAGSRAERNRQLARMNRAQPPKGKRMVLWFDTNQIPELMEHRWKRIQEFGKLSTIGYPPDDLNDYFDLGLPPHPTNVGTLPFSLQAVTDLGGGAPAPRTAPTPRRTDNARAMGLLDRLSDAMRAAPVAPPPALPPALPPATDARADLPRHYATLRRVFDAMLRPRLKESAKRYSRFYAEQRQRVLDRLDKLGTMRADDQPLSDAHSQDDVLKAIFPRADEDAALSARIMPLFTRHLQDGVEFFAEHEHSGDAELTFSVDDPRTAQALERRRLQGTLVNATTEDDFRNLLAAGWEAGDTSAQFADRIDEYYRANCTGDDKHRPQTAARTQTAGIVNDGRMLAAREAGGLKKGWLHGGSEEPRPAHLDAQAKYLAAPIGMDEKFDIEGEHCDAPGSTELSVGQVANCTCMVTFVAG